MLVLAWKAVGGLGTENGSSLTFTGTQNSNMSDKGAKVLAQDIADMEVILVDDVRMTYLYKKVKSAWTFYIKNTEKHCGWSYFTIFAVEIQVEIHLKFE